MKRTSLSRQRLAALAWVGAPLLTYPLLALPEGVWGGLPAPYVYLFAVWGGLLGMAAWIVERKGG